MCMGKLFDEVPEARMPAVRRKRGDAPTPPSEGAAPPLRGDALAALTRLTKVVLVALSDVLGGFQRSAAYKVLANTTQPAHLVLVLSVAVVSSLMLPRAAPAPVAPFWALVYLGAFSAHFGAQIWMTFFSGLSLYFSLPRHAFSDVQQVLFPKYFLLNAALSLATLTVFVKANNAHLARPDVAVQVAAMVVCFLVELVIRLYLTPPLLALMAVKNRIERAAGIGMEVGTLNAGGLMGCPHYCKIQKAFRRIHMTIAIGNMVAMGCTTFHLYYLSQKLCII